MITDAIVETLMGVLTGVLGLMPAYSLPAQIDDLGATLGGPVAGINGVFPIVTLGSGLAALIAVRLFLYLVAVVQWVYELVPFKAT